MWPAVRGKRGRRLGANVSREGPRSGSVNPRAVAIAIAHNEEHAIGAVLDRFQEVSDVAVAVVDDGSNDRTPRIVRERGAILIQRHVRGGAGAAIRTGFEWAREHRYDICVVLAGNDKDRPSEIRRLIDPIARDEADIVQGSRYLPGARSENMPWHRTLACRFIHPWLFSLAARRRLTDTTNGYRAVRLSVLDDRRIDLSAPWLDKYELEPYLLLTAIRLGYRVLEVPVTKSYPVDSARYTKMRPVTDWWRIIRPIVVLGLGLKR
jgi:dolichol-phosphate mannosyltransferase